MGNYRFRFSDILPYSWVYKLTRSTRHLHPPHQPQSSMSDQRKKSYHFSRALTNSPATRPPPDPPRKSGRRRRRHRPRKPPEPVSTKPPDSTPEQYPNSLDRSTSPDSGSDRVSCKCTQNNIVIEMDDGRPLDCGGHLRPIITKAQSQPTKISDLTPRRLSSSSSGVKLRTNSPRILNRRRSGRKVAESLAVAKSSRDPRRDFRESMVEMIVEYDLRAAKDLEELLACYLSLNSDEYHDIIISVFKQIWFDFIVHLNISTS